MHLAPTPRLIVFDLDGTLIDSRRDLCNSVNATLRHLGKPELPEAVISGYIGDGVSMLVRRAIGDPEGDVHDEEFVTEAITFFIAFYHLHKLDYTFLYPGVLQSLEAIQTACPHLLMAVLTNKPVRPARGICEGLGLAGYFLHIYGGDSFPLKKPDPLGLRTLMSEVGATPAETAMIGDSLVDVQTARNAGVWSIGCTFGFGNDTLTAAAPENQPDILVDSPRDWASALTPAALSPPRK